jgi:hypothetical protein
MFTKTGCENLMCKDDLEGRGFGWEDNVEIDIEE